MTLAGAIAADAGRCESGLTLVGAMVLTGVGATVVAPIAAVGELA